MSAHAVRRAAAGDLPHIAMVARATWPVAYADLIPDAIQRRLLDDWYSPESLGRALAARGPDSSARSRRTASSASRSTSGVRRCRSS